MVLAGDTLFVAGPADVIDEEQVFKQINDLQSRQRLDDQATAFEGKKGGLLWAVSAADGKRLAEQQLDVTPVFDGMAAAGGRLYMATTNGRVVCLAGR